MKKYYQLTSKEPPWADYGDILVHGMLKFVGTSGGQSSILIDRTGPFVPPISQPFGGIVVTAQFKSRLETEKFTGLEFLPATYSVVAHVNWHEWDFLADEPEFYPESGEPEDYLDKEQHVPDLVAEMPQLWIWNVKRTEDLQRSGSNSFYRERHPGTDVARDCYIFWISERLKDWLEANASDWTHSVEVVPRELPGQTAS